MSCECYMIGGPFIAEDPDCPIHGNARADAPAYVPLSESEVDALIRRSTNAEFADMHKFARMVESLVVARMRGDGK